MTYDPDNPPFTRGIDERELDENTREGFQNIWRYAWAKYPGGPIAIGAIGWLFWAPPVFHIGGFLLAMWAVLWLVRNNALPRAWAFAGRMSKRVRAFFLVRSEGQRTAARETRTMIGLMKDAAKNQETDERAREFLVSNRANLEADLARLLALPQPTRDQYIQIDTLTRWIREDRARIAAPIAPAPRIQGFAMPMMGAGIPVAWYVIAALGVTNLLTGAYGWVQGQRVDNLKRDAREYAQAVRDLQADLSAQRAAHARDVANVLEQTAETVEQLEQRRDRAERLARRERARNEELARNPGVDVGDLLRELAEPASSGAAPPSTDSASDVPGQPG